MADPQFFQKSGSFTVSEIAEITGAEISSGDGSLVLEDVASLDQAEAVHLSFLDNVKYKDALTKTKAGACLVHSGQAELVPDGVIALISPSPYKAYALAAQAFYPQAAAEASIHETAVIGQGAEIGEGTVIEAGVVIGENCKIGAQCYIGANAVISHAMIGDHVRIYRGAAIGQDGFGFAIDPQGHVKVPQLGRVIIEDHVEIGANTTIDRGAGPDTVIGQGTWIDNLVQIGHNVRIGKGCIIVSQVGISGSTVIEDFAALGGQVGVAGHLTIGKGARIAAKSGIMRDIPPGEEHMGYPAMPIKQFMKQVAFLKRLINKEK